jgi:GT2 family glycosyltransferase
MIVTGSLVYDSRNFIVETAIKEEYDYILFADSDMVFNADDLKRLLAHNVGICSGLYVKRNGSDENVAYSKIITRRRFPYREPKLIVDTSTTGFGRVAACGFGFCLIKVSVVKCMAKKFKSLFEPFKGVGEDVAFCIRAKRCGYKIYIDRDVKLGHIGQKMYRDRD